MVAGMFRNILLLSIENRYDMNGALTTV